MNTKQQLQDDWEITVCSSCLCASCWQGEFYCGNAKRSGTTEITIKKARSLLLESPDYWHRDESVKQRLQEIDEQARRTE